MWSLFAQDDFHVRPDLTLNLGLRYEQQTFTDSRKDFAPRVGFAYNVRGDGKTVIRGGFGIYYSQIVDNTAANWALTGPTGVFNYTASLGQVGFPTSVAAAPLPAFPAGARVPLRSLYVRPGDSANLDQYFPTSTLIGYQIEAPQPLLRPVDHRRRAQPRFRLGPVGRLCGLPHQPHQSPAATSIRPSPFIRTAPGQTRTAQAANCTRPYWIAWYAAARNRLATPPPPPIPSRLTR